MRIPVDAQDCLGICPSVVSVCWFYHDEALFISIEKKESQQFNMGFCMLKKSFNYCSMRL